MSRRQLLYLCQRHFSWAEKGEAERREVDKVQEVDSEGLDKAW